MLYLIDKIFGIFTSPFDLNLIGLLLISFLLICGWHSIGRFIAIFFSICNLLIWLFPVDDWLLAPLESRFPTNPPIPACLNGVILLGGGEDRRVSTAWHIPTLQSEFGAFLETARLAREHPEARIVFSGYGSSGSSLTSEASIAQQILIKLGVPENRILLETRSQDTWHNFAYSKSMIQPGPDESWVLVTRAVHIPRSIGIARRIGWKMIADPTDFSSLPSASGIQIADFGVRLNRLYSALHEWEGLIGYHLEGRTSEFLPSSELLPADSEDVKRQCR